LSDASFIGSDLPVGRRAGAVRDDRDQDFAFRDRFDRPAGESVLTLGVLIDMRQADCRSVCDAPIVRTH
jgi:hypothetical protein